eukprot:CAMPEP_0182441528 /NCGR_PEP_ID=MMETSP1172-20130603/504_1 /TAXON_ID=708627 /ORGANISM="Timspurckia oligopyrenoides, Strain CCMP3278" /LENGTH=472 /DNA_ID=CAMNT_0024635877 /DNA_START=34 /DNA_END=1449 /DNA_ORIENTATION=-
MGTLRRVNSDSDAGRLLLTPFQFEGLTIVVIGASGDLAKKKTYPSLYALWKSRFLPSSVRIIGYARSPSDDDTFRAKLVPYLEKASSIHGRSTETEMYKFLDRCTYRSGKTYEDEDAWKSLNAHISEAEENEKESSANRVFYFAIPPNVFHAAGQSLKQFCMGNRGWNRVVIEKPFGRDLSSFEELAAGMSELFTEEQMYRIDHYLGKEMVANIACLRFANTFLEPLWNRHYVKSVTITFKEDIGTEGRGGYFDKFGIIRDVMQNHLLQVLSIVAMEPPSRLAGEGFDQFIRDEKVKLLRCIDPIKLEECVLGQYVASDDGSVPGYLEDEGVPDDSVTPTFATCVLWIRNPRWEGVPFIMKAGKALNERKAEVRVQMHAPPAAQFLYPDSAQLNRNEFVMRMQPNEAIYMKCNVKHPGLGGEPVMSELDLSYKDRFPDEFSKLPDAYTRLILEVLRGNQAAFVREDELRNAW